MKDKRYIILGYNKESDTYYGYIECSFSMSYDEKRVKVYGNFKTKYSPDTIKNIMANCKNNFDGAITNELPNSYNQHLWFDLRAIVVHLNRTKYNNCVWRVYRVGSKNCPVTIDFSEIKLMKQGKMKYDKYCFRNQPFKRNGQ
jgi:hypothetical protein